MNEVIESLGSVANAIKILALLFYPLLLLIFLIYGFSKLWVTYVRAAFIANQKTQLLEVRIPKDIRRTPLAMEIVTNALYQTGGESTWYDRYILGKVRSWFSLEIASIGGHTHFFIWTQAKWKNLLESQLYAQYPGVEVLEVTDYAHLVPFDESRMSYWGCEFVFTKPDYIPLKTYVDYGMDKQAGMKEEDKLDPLLPTIEFMSTLKPEEQLWIQIVVRAHKKRRKEGSFFWWQTEKWQDGGKAFIKEKSATSTIGSEGAFAFTPTNKSDQVLIEAVDKNVSKFGFDTGIRAIYMAENSVFNGANIPGVIGSYRQFGANNLNSLRPNNVTDFDFPWTKVFKKKKLSEMKKHMLDAYKRRQFFHAPYIRKHQVLNSEQIATLYHFPSGIVETPAFERVSSRKAEPPVNLPI